ncbi:MAG: hypothetical protein UR39_C0017G0008 [Candidatus Woesebacteria bacterium GW2011_GWA1_33_30]|uniref:Integral membrane protein n=1 Tax=Candidatus Woesebacteria bacterium GW2011_GWA2_33_28 TaxID=1618561 RepID=A0A0G0A458_9BACT|nr:MAG: hypothetical protein UR38_C0015G0008 [Candidatus Woesebacteria bacterium GW2011_GWA2_33_28]KKP46342.1 MAG: hypothetical protein UR39_C0017G0008 [Candidatus Woesebacteria bacterium GW2011_GWA1_33_30]KKP47837.1 MAG: hypothetical protein UR40_C0017G0008 [Microgenomates group bacterium GW2011_GWC1_33_32]KKP51275.1 MAG: hypothetical protein UR44_C0014G0008 [Candidatus Woesebacteria bacterium GW2011_GWB1_33_38]
MIKLALDLKLYDGNGFMGFGPLGLEGKSAQNDAPIIFQSFISSAIGLVSIIAVIWFIFILLTGSLSLMTSGGDKATAENAKKKISNGLIGLLLTIFGIFLISLIGQVFGIKNILVIPALLETLGIK